MYCEKCGAKLVEGEFMCSICGYDFRDTNVTETEIVIEDNSFLDKIINKLDLIYFIIAIVVFVLFLMAASNVSSAGEAISEIRSVGGETLEEAYYQSSYGLYSGISMALFATGITLSSILVWFGIKSRSQNKNEKMS